MKRKGICILTLLLMTAAMGKAQKSQTALSMERQGLTDVTTLDNTLRVSLMYSRADNFTGRVLYKDLREAYLHPKAARALAKAQQLLKRQHPELSLIVFDAARPLSVQKQMYDAVAGTPQARYVSNPANGGGLHNFGLAVDLSICNAETGDTLDMGTVVDYLGPLAHTTDEADMVRKGSISATARRNRELLRQVMRQAGFLSISNEWWHFELVRRDEAKRLYRVIK